MTTRVLSRLYCEDASAIVLTQEASPVQVKKCLHHLSATERLLLLGHGSDCGLFSREFDGEDFNRIIVGHPHAYYLRGRSNTVAIWCNADLFARKEGLHGLFSGMIISEMEEAKQYAVSTSQEELDRELPLFVDRINAFLRSEMPLRDVPEAMLNSHFTPSELNLFNYSHLHFI